MWNEKSCRVHGKWQDQKYNGTSELSKRVNGSRAHQTEIAKRELLPCRKITSFAFQAMGRDCAPERARARERSLTQKQLWQTLIIMIIFQYVMGNLAVLPLSPLPPNRTQERQCSNEQSAHRNRPKTHPSTQPATTNRMSCKQCRREQISGGMSESDCDEKRRDVHYNDFYYYMRSQREPNREIVRISVRSGCEVTCVVRHKKAQQEKQVWCRALLPTPTNQNENSDRQQAQKQTERRRMRGRADTTSEEEKWKIWIVELLLTISVSVLNIQRRKLSDEW